jgi:sugar diacid utilization regulator
MGLTVREALSLQVLRDATVVAGHRGLDNPIRWTHIIDHPDVAEWVKGGEVLITTGLGIHGDTQAQVKYMTEAVEKKVAAVFITKQEYLPHATPEMREIADEYGLPLVELPPTTAFVEVTEAILRRLAARSIDAERHYLIDALLAGNLPESAEATARLSELGIDPDQHNALALAQCAGESPDQQLSDEDSRRIMGALNQTPRRAVLADRPSWVIAIFPLGSREESSTPFAHSLDGLLNETQNPMIRVGVGRLTRRLSDFPISYREAREALFIARISGDTRSVWHFSDLGAWRLLLRVEDQSELERLAHYYLSPLTGHDRDQQTNWLTTLETFLDQNGNLRGTARALELHRNTVTYQIENIGKILGQDLNNPEVRLNLQLALRARKLLHARNSNPE